MNGDTSIEATRHERPTSHVVRRQDTGDHGSGIEAQQLRVEPHGADAEAAAGGVVVHPLVGAADASTASTRSGSSVTQVMTGTPGSHSPVRSCTASITFVWLAIRIFGTRRCCAHRCSAGDSRSSATRGAAYCCFANRTGRSPQRQTTRVDEAAGDQRRPVDVVAHGADEAVVLVAEVDGERGDVAEHRAVVRCAAIRR